MSVDIPKQPNKRYINIRGDTTAWRPRTILNPKLDVLLSSQHSPQLYPICTPFPHFQQTSEEDMV